MELTQLELTQYLYPSPVPFSPLTLEELAVRRDWEAGETVVHAASPRGDRVDFDGAAKHANLSMAYTEARLVRHGIYKVPLAVTL